MNSTNLEREKDIFQLCLRITNGDKPSEAIDTYMKIVESINYREVIWVVDKLVKFEIPMPELKKGVNKFLNLFYNTLNEADNVKPKEKAFLWYMEQNNREMEERLKSVKPLLKKINRKSDDYVVIKQLINKLEDILRFDNHYIIKENILFPLLEKKWEHFRCLQVMWSFHDDIRKNIKKAIDIFEQAKVDLEGFNLTVGNIFFNMYSIKFREEKLLFPFVLDTVDEQDLELMLKESLSFQWPYITPDIKLDHKRENTGFYGNEVQLETGQLLPKQIQLIFNHLPVDITFVDENNKVKYFSSPKKRIFPRSKSIIGREVNNCHPPESVHVVEKIVESFRSGERDEASFWIKLKGEFILIQYFAVRDEDNSYKGVVEVSQEITDIKLIEGEKRLLDWEE